MDQAEQAVFFATPVSVEMTRHEWAKIMAALVAFDSVAGGEEHREIVSRIDAQLVMSIDLEGMP